MSVLPPFSTSSKKRQIKALFASVVMGLLSSMGRGHGVTHGAIGAASHPPASGLRAYTAVIIQHCVQYSGRPATPRRRRALPHRAARRLPRGRATQRKTSGNTTPPILAPDVLHIGFGLRMPETQLAYHARHLRPMSQSIPRPHSIRSFQVVAHTSGSVAGTRWKSGS